MRGKGLKNLQNSKIEGKRGVLMRGSSTENVAKFGSAELQTETKKVPRGIY